jgi:hypothetical protein
MRNRTTLACLRIASRIYSKQRHVEGAHGSLWGRRHCTVKPFGWVVGRAGEREAIMETRRASARRTYLRADLTGRRSRTDTGASGRKGVGRSAPIEPRVEAALAERFGRQRAAPAPLCLPEEAAWPPAWWLAQVAMAAGAAATATVLPAYDHCAYRIRPGA